MIVTRPRASVVELPGSIERLQGQLAALEADAGTLAAGDPDVLVVGGRAVAPQDPALAAVLDRIAGEVGHRRRFPVGRYRGLAFGIDMHPGGAADVYIEGRGSRTGVLNALGPRAVLNALGRVADSYAEVIGRVKQDRDIAQRQLADYEARLGRAFPHAAYLEELTGLRDLLKAALSETPAGGEPAAGELADRITALRASHRVEADPARIRENRGADVVPQRVEAPGQIKAAERPTPDDVKPEDGTPADAGSTSRGAPAFATRVKKLQQRSLF